MVDPPDPTDSSHPVPEFPRIEKGLGDPFYRLPRSRFEAPPAAGRRQTRASKDDSTMSHASTSRHAQNVGHFEELVGFCAGLDPARYHPVRLNLKIKALQEALALAREAVATEDRAHAELVGPSEPDTATAAAEESRREAHRVHDQAREARNAVLYAPGEGLVDLANDCKTYLKTLKGPKEANLHHITHLEFRAPA